MIFKRIMELNQDFFKNNRKKTEKTEKNQKI